MSSAVVRPYDHPCMLSRILLRMSARLDGLVSVSTLIVVSFPNDDPFCPIEQSRRCPLCSGHVGEYLIHNIRSKYDFSKHYLTALRTSPRPEPASTRASNGRRRNQRQDVRWGRDHRRERERELRAADDLERAIEKRRWIYRNNLYAKVRHKPRVCL